MSLVTDAIYRNKFEKYNGTNAHSYKEIWQFKWINKKICRQKMSIMFSQIYSYICMYMHTYIKKYLKNTYTYIYICVYKNVSVHLLEFG